MASQATSRPRASPVALAPHFWETMRRMVFARRKIGMRASWKMAPDKVLILWPRVEHSKIHSLLARQSLSRSHEGHRGPSGQRTEMTHSMAQASYWNISIELMLDGREQWHGAARLSPRHRAFGGDFACYAAKPHDENR